MCKKVTIDFDSTLTRKDVQEYVKELLEKGVDVWVLTSRFDDLTQNTKVRGVLTDNHDLWYVVDTLGIPRHKVRFTCMKSKAEYLKRSTVIWHLDDWDEALDEFVEMNIKPVGINVTYSGWRTKCDNLLN